MWETHGGSPAIIAASDALAAGLSDEDENVRVMAAAQLALRDDPRGDEVLRGLEPADEDSPCHWLLHDVRRDRQLTPQDSIAVEE